MNPHNPLLNRLFDTKSSKKQHRPTLKDDLANRDKVLVPKLQTKKDIEALPDTSDRQKTTILKPHKTILPSLPQKESVSKKTTFR